MRFLTLLWLSLAVAVATTTEATEAKSTGIRTLFLIRHGTYVQGEEDAGALTPLGREQVAFVAGRLARLDLPFDRIVSSRIKRAVESGDIIAATLKQPIERDELLNESIPAGIGLEKQGIKPTPGAEAQFDAAWAKYSQPTPDRDHNEILACHGDIIRWFVCRALGVDPTHWTQMSIGNGSLTVIRILPDGTTRLFFFNDVSHVPLDKQTWSGTNRPLWRQR